MLQKKQRFLLLFSLAFFSLSCSVQKNLSRKEIKTLDNMVEQSTVFSGAFTGFVLLDPASGDILYQKNARKYFTPASNTKILTFYTSLKVLGDSFPLLHYSLKNDSLIFWGAGNPLLLHPEMPEDHRVFSFLQKQGTQLFYSDHNYHDQRFGSGWAWDDYPYAYQVEKSPLPLYNNMVQFEKDSVYELLHIYPTFFKKRSKLDEMSKSDQPVIQREWAQNNFTFNELTKRDSGFSRTIPFIVSPELTAALLSDTIDKEVKVIENYHPEDFHTLSQHSVDTLYRRLMQQSDNFIAEQLMLMCSDKLFDTLNTAKAIAYAQEHFFNDLPDDLRWVDGSGLSRYNLFTPMSVAKILQKLHKEVPEHRLFSIFPAGGVSGTIKAWYGNTEPYIFAKTGTLANRHCLSGYLKTQNGKTLIFSFMHNNYTSGSRFYKMEMEKVLAWIAEEY